MSDERNQFPEHFTFSKRNGYEELPEPMRLEYLSKDLRREVLDEIHSFLEDMEFKHEYKSYKQFTGLYSKYVRSVLGKVKKIPKNKVNIIFSSVIKDFESILLEDKFYVILDCLEIMIHQSSNLYQEFPPYEELNDLQKSIYIVRQSYEERRQSQNSRINKNDRFKNQIIRLFDKYSSAYQLNTSQHPCWFYPRVSKEQGKATQQAIKTVHQGEMNSAATHLRQAAEHINMRQYADSVADSIHAVESVARTIDPNDGDSLGKALKSLEDDGLLKHKALKQAFMKLYGYTSDEQGIRHALLDQNSADVGLDEAIFMFGACASFAAYLTRKHQQQTKT
ncbi:MAG: hypothetical protein OXI23_18110 [Gemmatimonadota bacterium]|nr:hypothetical protein [Gemmatimonadota bacterium]